MEQQKSRMEKRQFRIGDLSKKLKVKKFVIRFWEKEFGLKSDRSQGGQRFYSQEDFNIFQAIKDLLYNQKFTIPGAKKQLESLLNNKISATPIDITPAQKTSELPEPKIIEKIVEIEKIIEKPVEKIPQDFLNQIKTIKSKLIEIKNKL